MAHAHEHFGTLSIDPVMVHSPGGNFAVPTKDGIIMANQMGGHWALREHGKPERLRLKSGDVLTIFNTIAKGEIAWSGIINYKNIPADQRSNRFFATTQSDMDVAAWPLLFGQRLPAILEKPTGTFHGALEPLWKADFKEIVWSVSVYDKSGDDALYTIENRDKLSIYSKVTDGQKLLDQTLFLTPKTMNLDYTPQHPAPMSTTPRVRDIDAFKQAFINHLPARVFRIS